MYAEYSDNDGDIDNYDDDDDDFDDDGDSDADISNIDRLWEDYSYSVSRSFINFGIILAFDRFWRTFALHQTVINTAPLGVAAGLHEKSISSGG